MKRAELGGGGIGRILGGERHEAQTHEPGLLGIAVQLLQVRGRRGRHRAKGVDGGADLPVDDILHELRTGFLQRDLAPSRRKNTGLQAVFTEVFPIESYDGKVVLKFHSYEIGDPKIDWLECIREGLTFGAPLHVTFHLEEEAGIKEEKVFMGELPLMTPQGTFVINGAERVIVSQLHRSPGLAFEATQHANGKMLHGFRIIPDRGSWYEAQFDTSDLLYVYLDRKKRRRKFLVTTFFRALAFLDDKEKGEDKNIRGTNSEILRLFYDVEELTIKQSEALDDIQNKVLIEDAMDLDKGIVVARAFEPLSKVVVRQIAELGFTKIKVVDTTIDDGIVIKCLKKDPTCNEDEALKDIYRRLRPGDPPTATETNFNFSGNDFGGLGFGNGILSSNLGFDIFGPTGEAFVSVQLAAGGVSSFGTVNLATGLFTAIGDVDGGVGLRSLTAIPTPGAVAVLGLGGLLAARRRR